MSGGGGPAFPRKTQAGRNQAYLARMRQARAAPAGGGGPAAPRPATFLFGAGAGGGGGGLGALPAPLPPARPRFSYGPGGGGPAGALDDDEPAPQRRRTVDEYFGPAREPDGSPMIRHGILLPQRSFYNQGFIERNLTPQDMRARKFKRDPKILGGSLPRTPDDRGQYYRPPARIDPMFTQTYTANMQRQAGGFDHPHRIHLLRGRERGNMLAHQYAVNIWPNTITRSLNDPDRFQFEGVTYPSMESAIAAQIARGHQRQLPTARLDALEARIADHRAQSEAMMAGIPHHDDRVAGRREETPEELSRRLDDTEAANVQLARAVSLQAEHNMLTEPYRQAQAREAIEVHRAARALGMSADDMDTHRLRAFAAVIRDRTDNLPQLPGVQNRVPGGYSSFRGHNWAAMNRLPDTDALMVRLTQQEAEEAEGAAEERDIQDEVDDDI